MDHSNAIAGLIFPQLCSCNRRTTLTDKSAVLDCYINVLRQMTFGRGGEGMATLGSWMLFSSFMYAVGTFGQMLLH